MFDMTSKERIRDKEEEEAIARFFGLPEEILQKYRETPKKETEGDNTFGDGI